MSVNVEKRKILHRNILLPFMFILDRILMRRLIPTQEGECQVEVIYNIAKSDLDSRHRCRVSLALTPCYRNLQTSQPNTRIHEI